MRTVSVPNAQQGTFRFFAKRQGNERRAAGMFRKMRRVKRELPMCEAKRLLREDRRAALAMIGDEGWPYAIPVNFYYDEAEGRIYFHGAKCGHKADAMRASNKVCLTTWDDGYLEEGDWAYYVSSCVVFGRVSFIEDAALAKEKLRALASKYYPSQEEVDEEMRRDFAAAQMFAIDIEHMSAKRVHEK